MADNKDNTEATEDKCVSKVRTLVNFESHLNQHFELKYCFLGKYEGNH